MATSEIAPYAIPLRLIDAARFYGSGSRGKEAVYEVDPEGDLELDPDDTKGLSFACPKARIIAIHRIPGKVIQKHQKAMLKRAHELERQRAAKAAEATEEIDGKHPDRS